MDIIADALYLYVNGHKLTTEQIKEYEQHGWVFNGKVWNYDSKHSE